MKDIKFRDGKDFIYEALGIPKERASNLEYRMALIIHEIFRPTKTGTFTWTDAQILKLFLALAETDEERVLCSYCAGRKAEELASQYDLPQEDFED